MRNISTFIRSTLLLLTACFFITTHISAQQLPNSNFETFETGFNGVGEQPTGWKGSNVNMSSPASVRTVLVNSENAGRSGKCVYLHNEESGAMGITKPASAYITLGKPWAEVAGMSANGSFGGTEGGISFSYRPDTISVWIKRTYTSQENARIVLYLWSGTASGSSYKSRGNECKGKTVINEETDVRGRNSCTTTQPANFIGNGEWLTNQQINDWQEIKVPVSYFNNDRPQMMNIIISAANYPLSLSQQDLDQNSYRAGSKMWVDDLKLIYSSKIHELRVNNRAVTGFSPEQTTYTVALGQGVTTIPPIKAFRSGRELGAASGLSSEIQITNGVVDGAPTTVKVNAEDGSSSTTYTIYFVSQQSSNSRPNAIKINGSTLPNFNGYVTNYTYQLPYGTTQCPEITVEKAEASQTVEVNCTAVPGVATVKVTAQDGSFTTYTITFSVEALSDNTLQNILVNGNPLPGFSPTQNNYTVNLPLGTTQAPTITPVSAYANGLQTIQVVSNTLNDGATITVSAPGNHQTRTYRIRYVITVSSNSQLAGIQIGGVDLAGFEPSRFEYQYSLPIGTTQLPAITWTLGESTQQATLTTNGVNGETRILVTAENGSTSLYKIYFSVNKSQNSKLASIKADGVQIAGFHPDILNYDIVLPSGTTTMPTITYDKGDPQQTVRLNLGSIGGQTTLRVTAEDVAFTTTYTLNISVQMSAAATLQNIFVGGVALPDFEPDKLNYTYTLADDATVCPEITVEKVSAGQRVYITRPQLEGVATIEVKPETNSSSNIYRITFGKQKSSNNLLTSISVNGTAVAGFAPTTTDYTVSLPTNTTSPVITYTKADATCRVVWVDRGVAGSELIATAENGAKQTYHISYNIAASRERELSDLLLYESTTRQFVQVQGFSPTNHNYTVELPWGTKRVPSVYPVGKEAGQKIEVRYGKVDAITTVTVTSESGLSLVYNINFKVKKSNISQLNAIYLDGNLVENFQPNNFAYNVSLPYGSVDLPKITFDRGLHGGDTIFGQKVKITARPMGQTSEVEVTAEDGSKSTYQLHFTLDMSQAGANTLQSILVGGIGVNSFQPNGSAFDVVLPFGTTLLPEITFVKNYVEQSVLVESSGIDGATKLIVKSNIAGVADKVYTLNISVAGNPIKLNSISADGVQIAGFNSEKLTYILPITSLPTLSYDYDQTSLFISEDKNHKRVKIKVEDLNDPTISRTYTVYFYYENDVLPNGGFEQWSATTYNNKQKPTGWNVPVDALASTTCWLFPDPIGEEVSKETGDVQEGSSAVLLSTKYHSTVMEWFPGLMTLGNFWHNGKGCRGQQESKVVGGIDFRNTPDSVSMQYKLAKLNGNNMMFTFQLWNDGVDYSDAQKVVDLKHTDGTVDANNWKNLSMPITYSANNMSPKRLNIVVNASQSNNIKELWGAIGSSKLLADELKIYYSSKLQNIKVEGADLAGFSADVYQYNYTLPANFAGVPKIEPTGEVLDQEHTVAITDENEQRERTATITSKAENGSSVVYTINFIRPADTVCNLKNIVFNGTQVAGFSPETLSYNLQGNHISTLRLEKNSVHSTLSYTISTNQVKIVVKAESGDSNVYLLNIAPIIPTDTDLTSIEVVGHSISYSATQMVYNVTLGAGVEELPQITFRKKQNAQTVVLNIGDTTTLDVTAADNSSTAQYKIIFTKTSTPLAETLNSILLDGVAISNFHQDTLVYKRVYSNVKEKLSFHAESNSVVETFRGDTVKIEVGGKVYKVIFSKKLSENSDLQNIFVEATALNGFQAGSLEYNCVWNNAQLPDLHVVAGEGEQEVDANWQGRRLELTVKAENTLFEQNYAINFTQSNASNNSQLESILLAGAEVTGFLPSQNTYTVMLPEGTTQIPDLSFIKGDDSQTVGVSTHGNAVTITVTAADGVSTTTYTLTFNIQLSDNALLNAIFVGGVELTGFSPSQMNYTYSLPFGTTALPQVEYEKGHAGQTVTVEPNGVRGVYKINVTSESGEATNQYTIAFSVEKSNDASLYGIKVDGMAIIGFNSEIYEYTVDLPYGTTNVPTVTATAKDNTQTIVITPATTLADTTVITVTAEDGTTVRTYKVSFKILKSSNAYLADILIDGEPLRVNASNHKASIDFAKTEYWYNVMMPYATTTAPVVTWLPDVADYDTIYIEQNGGLEDTIDVKITVVSQDLSTTNEYFLTVFKEKSNNSRLADIRINGNTISGFHSDTLFYHIQHPVHSDPETVWITPSQVAWSLGEEHQTASIAESENHTLIITVTAQDGVSTTIYVITQERLLSDNALLADLKVGGVSLQDFQPEKFDYIYMLPFASVQVLEVDYLKGEEEQTVDVAKGFVNEKTFVYVTAEDGKTTNTYSVLFKVSEDNPGEIPTAEDVCFSRLGDQIWKATSKRNNVEIAIYDRAGRLIFRADVPLSDPNDELCQSSTFVSIPIMQSGVYVYSFIYNKKRVIFSGKFVN